MMLRFCLAIALLMIANSVRPAVADDVPQAELHEASLRPAEPEPVAAADLEAALHDALEGRSSS